MGRTVARGALWLPLLALACVLALPFATGAAAEFRADDWVIDCSPRRPDADCSIIVPFRERSNRGAVGAFALAIDLRSGVLALVGAPGPLAARLQVDRNPPVHCTGPRQCVFSGEASAAARGELAGGSIALVDIATKSGTFHASLSAKGYRAGLAQIRAWAYPEITLQGRHR